MQSLPEGINYCGRLVLAMMSERDSAAVTSTETHSWHRTTGCVIYCCS